jgi:eukaryotic-like serine/threonine-protein kinase
MAGVVVLLGVVTYAWSLAASGHSPSGPTKLAALGKCVVSYQVTSDDGKEFKANVTVANRDTVAADAWKLWFVLPGDQHETAGLYKADVHQADQSVTVQSATSLNPQQSKTVQIAGRYTTSNAAPMVFQLNNQTCEAYVSGKPGEPSRPVERLTDGTVRLGPVPTSKNPAPGITISPGGVAIPVPIIKITRPPASVAPTPTATKTKGPAVEATTPTPVLPSPGASLSPTPAATTPSATEAPTEPVIGGGGNGCDLEADPDCGS